LSNFNKFGGGVSGGLLESRVGAAATAKEPLWFFGLPLYRSVRVRGGTPSPPT